MTGSLSGGTPIRSSAGGFIGEANAWCQGRWWQWRVPVLLFLAWDGLRHLNDPEAGGLFAGITFGVHEFGHLLFAFFGEFMTVLGGSLNQLLIPVAAGALLYHHRDFFGIAGAGAWLASSLFDLSRYIGDARSFDLDLLSLGEGGQHDWAWLLGRLGLLPYDTRIAAFTHATGAAILATAIGFGAWLCIKMWRASRQVA